MRTAVTIVVFLLFLACGSQTSGEPDLDMIRDRLDRNACRIVREDLVFEIVDLEFLNDTTYSEIPSGLLPDSLTACPVTLEALQLFVDGGDRKIVCPSGHGETEF